MKTSWSLHLKSIVPRFYQGEPESEEHCIFNVFGDTGMKIKPLLDW
jgi:hypothetical protein